MSFPDGNANYPFASTSVRVGSFITSDEEAVFAEHILRAKAYRLSFTSDLTWHQSATPGDELTVVPIGTGLIIECGVDTTVPLGAYVDENDIIISWRETRLQEEYVDGDLPGVNQLVDIRWGPGGEYENSDGGAILGSGTLTSSLIFEGDTGDAQGFLGTEQGLEVRPGVFLSEAQGINLILRHDGVDVISIPLYRDDGTDFASDFWTCDDIIIEIYEWWPWEVNGTPTWDVDNGDELADPLRNDADGRPRALAATNQLV